MGHFFSWKIVCMDPGYGSTFLGSTSLLKPNLRTIWLSQFFLILTDDHAKSEADAEVTLEAGEYEYPFEFNLPTKDFPDPFEGQKYGHIRYKVKAKISRPWKFDHETVKLLNVAGAGLDLNTMAALDSVSTCTTVRLIFFARCGSIERY